MYILLHEDRTVTTTDKEPKLDAMEWPQVIRVDRDHIREIIYLQNGLIQEEYEVSVLVPGNTWQEVEDG